MLAKKAGAAIGLLTKEATIYVKFDSFCKPSFRLRNTENTVMGDFILNLTNNAVT